MAAVRVRSNPAEAKPPPSPSHHHRIPRAPATLPSPSIHRRSASGRRSQVWPPPLSPPVAASLRRSSPPRASLWSGKETPRRPAPAGGYALAGDGRSQPGQCRPRLCLASPLFPSGKKNESGRRALTSAWVPRAPHISHPGADPASAF
ncbi:hypothetical protein VPH35_089668 [Triticum aestivum]